MSDRIDALDSVTKLVGVETARAQEERGHRKNAALPACVKPDFVALREGSAEAVSTQSPRE